MGIEDYVTTPFDSFDGAVVWLDGPSADHCMPKNGVQFR